MPLHADQTGANLHVPGRTGSSDPGAIGAAKEWYDDAVRRSQRRNSTDTGWEDPGAFALVSTHTTHAYTLVLADAYGFLRVSDPTSSTVTVPTNASVAFPVGTIIRIKQQDAGPVLIDPFDSTVIINSRGGRFTTNGTSAVAILVKEATNEWTLYGDLTT